jgi:pilus assembly protein CpaC
MSTEPPSMKEADGEASAAGNMTPAASAAAPVVSATGVAGAGTVAAAPPSPRAPSPATPVEEEKTEEAPVKKMSAAGKTPAEEEASVGQVGATVAPPPEVPSMNNEGARASPQHSVVATMPTGADQG